MLKHAETRQLALVLVASTIVVLHVILQKYIFSAFKT